MNVIYYLHIEVPPILTSSTRLTINVYSLRTAKVSNCNGGGQCGTCVVQVKDADGWDERSDWEAGKLKVWRRKSQIKMIQEGDR